MHNFVYHGWLLSGMPCAKIPKVGDLSKKKIIFLHKNEIKITCYRRMTLNNLTHYVLEISKTIMKTTVTSGYKL